MDFHASDRDEVVNRLAWVLSEALSFEGLRHFVYESNETNDGVAMISDSEQPFDIVKFENLVPRKWDVTVAHQEEDATRPFAILRVFKNGDFAFVRKLDVNNVMESAQFVKRHTQ